MYLVFSAEYLAKKSPGVGAPKQCVLGAIINGGVACVCEKCNGAFFVHWCAFLRIFVRLASQKIAIAEKSLAFSNCKVQIASFTAEIAEKSPEDRRKNRRKIAAIFRVAE